MNRRGLFKKHFYKKKNINICSETAKIANFHFSHYKSMETISCHSNQSSYPIGQKTILFVPPTYRCYVWNMARISFMVSEELSFENADEGQRQTEDGPMKTDGWRIPAYTISSPMSLWLRWAKNCKIILIKMLLAWHTDLRGSLLGLVNPVWG